MNRHDLYCFARRSAVLACAGSTLLVPLRASPQHRVDGAAASAWSIPARYRGMLVTHRLRYFPSKLLALTFDDGPDPHITPAILDALKLHHAKATFFVLGRNAQRFPHLVRAAVRAGHCVGSHSYSHPAHTNAPQAAMELDATREAIYKAAGAAPTVFRPPYGITRGELAKAARRRGYAVITWTISSADTRPISPQQIARNVIFTPNPGDIVLMHDGGGHRATAAALPLILRALNKQGWRFVTVPELLRAWDQWQRRTSVRRPLAPGR
ncbi:MAG: polysaccharide deacetylase family protein [Chthonomonadales bacterium]